jgi:dTDP-4-amino-4,6-dideoxygalactose transaminase
MTGTLPTWPVFDDEMLRASSEVLTSGRVNYWTGSEGRTFEAELAASVGRRHALALSNGTVAIELALHALGVGPGDEVVVPSRTFIATASAVVAVGAVPVVADVDPDTQGLSAETVAAVLTDRTRAVVPVHLGGCPVDWDPLQRLADERGLWLVEDCAQAIGGTYRGRPIGSLGHAAAFSFCQDKIVTTAGEGGALLLDDEDLFRKAWAYKDHGKSWEAVHEREHPPGFRWLHESFGTNMRMTEVQAAVGRVALRRLPGWIEQRRRNAAVLSRALGGHPALRVPELDERFGHAFYRWYAFLDPGALAPGWTRDRVVEAVVARGTPCFSGSCSEIYLETAFAPYRPPVRLPCAAELGERSLALLVHPTLTEAHVQRAAGDVLAVLEEAAAR